MTTSTLADSLCLSESSVRGTCGVKEERGADFITVLAVAQKYEIDMLPLTWQVVLEAGKAQEGGTSKINERVVDLQTSFAFKCIKTKEKEEHQESTLLQMITKEVAAFGNPQIRNHPHVAQLQGLCWDISTDGTVWPVLVFEKSKLGDLYQYMSSDAGKDADLFQRLKLCMDVGIAIQDLHGIGIVHGDIKPDNVLIVHDENGLMCAKVIDFGYSAQYTTNSDRFPLKGRTWPWFAPEQDRIKLEFSLSDAKKVDVFCFGMLCFWTIFMSLLDGDTPLPEHCGWAQPTFDSCCGERATKQRLQKLKGDSKLQKLAKDLVATFENLDNDQRAALDKLFDKTLQARREDRESDLRQLLDDLVPQISGARNKWRQTISTGEEFSQGTNIASYITHDFDISTSISALYRADYRVRIHIYVCMCRREKQLNGRPLLDSSARKSRIQLALCHRLGFGGAVPANSELLHEHFGEIANDVDRLIDEIRNVSIKTFGGDIVLRSVQSGSFPAIGTGEQYSTLSLLAEAEKRIKSEADALKSSLGTRPPNIPRLLLELALGSINMAQGRLKRAAFWLEVAGDTSCELLGLANSHTLTIVGNIATVYRDLKDYEQAEKFFNCQLKGEQILYKPDNHRLLNTMMNMAALYIDQSKSHEAEELLKKILHKKKTSLGIGHEDTLAAMTNLAIAYRNQSQWKKAEDIEIQVLEIRKRFLPPHHPDVLTARNNLSHTYKSQNRWDDALAIDEAVYKLRKMHLGPYHHATLASMASLAQVYHHMNFWDKALKLGLETLFLVIKIRGKGHIDTISAKIMVAQFCLDREQNREALQMPGQEKLVLENNGGVKAVD